MRCPFIILVNSPWPRIIRVFCSQYSRLEGICSNPCEAIVYGVLIHSQPESNAAADEYYCRAHRLTKLNSKNLSAGHCCTVEVRHSGLLLVCSFCYK